VSAVVTIWGIVSLSWVLFRRQAVAGHLLKGRNRAEYYSQQIGAEHGVLEEREKVCSEILEEHAYCSLLMTERSSHSVQDQKIASRWTPDICVMGGSLKLWLHGSMPSTCGWPFMIIQLKKNSREIRKIQA